MTLFRRSPPLRVAAREPSEDPWPEMPPRPRFRPPPQSPPSDPGLCGAWITQVPLNASEDPCGRGPMARATSKSGGIA